MLKEHLSQKKAAERFKFNMRDRKEGESISEYLAELSHLTENFDYRDQLEDMLSILRDQLVCLIKHEQIQQRLLSKSDSLKLQWALDIAH